MTQGGSLKCIGQQLRVHRAAASSTLGCINEGSSAAHDLVTDASAISPTHRLGERGSLRCSPLSGAMLCTFRECVGAAWGSAARAGAARARISADWLRVLLPLHGATAYGTHVAWW
jgi:hypothetical protein